MRVQAIGVKRIFWRNFLRHAAVVTASAMDLTLGSASTNEAAASTARDKPINLSTNYAFWRTVRRWLAARRMTTPTYGALTA